MSGFTETALVKKLHDLNCSQQSIQTLSFWLIHHRKHHATVVSIWFRELLTVKDGRQLTFMYLANDVIQNSKKKGPEYGREFGEVLKKSFEFMRTTGIDEKTKNSLMRILNIWEERGVYDAKQVQDFKETIDPNEAVKGKKRKSSETSVAEPKAKEPVEKKSRNGTSVVATVDRRERKKSETYLEVDGLIETHVTLSPKTPPGDPPEPEELIKALLELENSASSDAAVRERIASLPPEVSEVSLLTKLDNREAAFRLSELVSAAVQLLVDYNARLTNELERRRKTAAALRDFAQAQKDLTKQAEERLEEYNEKLQKVYAVRGEIKSHLESLPDVKQLPDVTRGLAPLPSAGDLFSMPTLPN
ncbi:regulation of nuclear pre-mRNA domain-containing protein 1B [Arctopsyche grandis]|uniref:regulation of nuclear pre-mRNA domain-containing protein 1B n=1 Tax=Arctopsyche grandis TaxID=121162 RepID=UPI00406D7646